MQAHRLLFLPLLCALWACADSGAPRCKIEPQIFCAPYAKWQADMPPEAAEKLKHMTRQEIRLLTPAFGQGVRNEFGLWQDNEITRFFKSTGLDHPDYMSAPFTIGFVAYLNSQSADMAEIARQYIPPEPPPPPPGQ